MIFEIGNGGREQSRLVCTWNQSEESYLSQCADDKQGGRGVRVRYDAYLERDPHQGQSGGGSAEQCRQTHPEKHFRPVADTFSFSPDRQRRRGRGSDRERSVACQTSRWIIRQTGLIAKLKRKKSTAEVCQINIALN